MFIYILVAAFLGSLIPLAWLGVYYLSKDGQNVLFALPSWVETLFIAFCPSSLLLLADPLDERYLIPFLVIFINVLLYILIGMSIWFGCYRSKVFLFFLLAILAAYFYAIFTL